MSMKAWIRMPLELLQRQGLSKSAAITLGVIIDRCTDTPSGVAAITQQEIAAAAGYDPRTIRRALKELLELELISYELNGRAPLYKLTGCVELLPPKKRSSKEQLRNDAKEAAYMSLVNTYTQKGAGK